jgi:hypothetical protein
MNPIKSKHIVIGLVIGFILFLFYRIGEENYSSDQTQGPISTQPSYRSYESKQTYSSSSTWSHNSSNLTRHEVLQSKVKGYREESYWGEQTSTAEKVKHFSGDEFDRFIEDVELNDADVYWGATY